MKPYRRDQVKPGAVSAPGLSAWRLKISPRGQRREGFFKTVLSDVPLHRSLLRRSALRNFHWLQ